MVKEQDSVSAIVQVSPTLPRQFSDRERIQLEQNGNLL